jgi:hypothetical protein
MVQYDINYVHLDMTEVDGIELDQPGAAHWAAAQADIFNLENRFRICNERLSTISRTQRIKNRFGCAGGMMVFRLKGFGSSGLVFVS